MLSFIHLDVKNVKQWFYSTKERCDSLKSHMKYMKMLYHDMPKIQETKKTLCDPNWQNCKIKTSSNDETIVSRQVNCNNSLEKYSDNLCMFLNENDAIKCNKIFFFAVHSFIIVNYKKINSNAFSMLQMIRSTKISLSQLQI